MPTLLPSEEVSQQLRIGGKNPSYGKAVLARYRRDGLPCYRFGSSKVARILYPQEDLDKWVKSQRVSG